MIREHTRAIGKIKIQARNFNPSPHPSRRIVPTDIAPRLPENTANQIAARDRRDAVHHRPLIDDSGPQRDVIRKKKPRRILNIRYAQFQLAAIQFPLLLDRVAFHFYCR